MGKGKMVVLFVIALAASLAGCNEQVEKAEQPTEAASPTDLETKTFALCEPTITVVNPITSECDGNPTSVFVDYDIAGGGDAACSLFSNVTIEASVGGGPYTELWTGSSNDDPPPFDFGYGGTSLRITARDTNNNDSSSVITSVQIEDTRAPTITPGGDIEAECSGPETTLITPNVPTIRDACDTMPLVETDLLDPPEYAFGNDGVVNITATDNLGQQSTGSYNIRIVDTTPPTINAGQDFTVATAGDCAFTTALGPGSGTLVTLPQPIIEDACSYIDDIAITNDRSNTPDRTVCVRNDTTTTVTWTVIDPSGNNTTDSIDVTAAIANANITLNSSPAGWSNGSGDVSATLDGAVGAVNWTMIGDAPPTNPPGTGSTGTATFGTNGTYCPLYISARDGVGNLGVNQQSCFGIESILPSGTFGAVNSGLLAQEWIDLDDPLQTITVDPANPDTWPVVFEGERVRTEITANDITGDIRSGLARVQLMTNPGEADEHTLIDWTGTAAGTLPTGPMEMTQVGCNTPDPACKDGQFDVSVLPTGNHEIALITTDFAGNQNTQTWYFRVKNYGDALSDIINLFVTLHDHPNTAVSFKDEIVGSGAGTILNPSPDSILANLGSAERLFSSSPGYAFLLSKKSVEILDESEANGQVNSDLANFISSFIARGIKAEVRRLVTLTENQGWENWNPLDDPNRDNERYLDRELLYGRFSSYDVEVNASLALAGQQVSSANLEFDNNSYIASIDEAFGAFNSIATLYDDQIWATAFERPANMLGNDTPERIFRGSSPTGWGLDIAQTVVNQITRVESDPSVPSAAKAALASVKDKMDLFARGVGLIGVPEFTNERYTREIYLTAQAAVDVLRTISEDGVYTYYWQTGLAHVLVFVVNYSLYEGPTSITFRGDLVAAVREGTYTTLYPDVAVAECRYDRGVQAVVDGQLNESLRSALDLFKNTKCLIVQLYNTYWGLNPIFDRDNPIDPSDIDGDGTPGGVFGSCPVAPIVAVPADECGECFAVGGGTPDNQCDGVDNDCDGSVDEGWVAESCGAGPCAATSVCANGVELPCVVGEPLATVDVTCDGVDDDCDGTPDDEWEGTACGDCGCESVSTCDAGVESACVPLEAGEEICDGLDNNCNCITDEGLDQDQDGFGQTGGEGCPGGAQVDCDDGNPFINPDALEVCDTRDNDCDTEVDEFVLNRCGNCLATCTHDGYGNCDDCIEFDPNPDNSTSVGTDPDGNLVLEQEEIDAEFAWVANYTVGTISKFDTTTGDEVGRYASHTSGGTGGSPSRTAIDGDGNVYVGNRGANYGLTKIGNWTSVCDSDVALCECEDRNGNGVIETSKDNNGDGDAADAGENLGAADECLLWSTQLTSTTHGTTGIVRAVAIDADGFIWAGEWNKQTMHRFDKDGNQVAWVQTNANAYGAAIDPNGILWMSHSCCSNGIVQNININNVVNNGTGGGNNAAALSPTYRMPDGGGYGGYGIAIDGDNRVWLGSYGQAGWMAARFDPSTGAWSKVPAVCRAHSGLGRGITVIPSAPGEEDIVWVAQHGGPSDSACDGGWSGGRVTGFRADSWDIVKDRNIAAHCTTPTGVGAGAGNFIWLVCQSPGNIYAMSPDPASNAFLTSPAGGSTYTYSDFTGNLFKSFTAPVGDLIITRKACNGTLNLTAPPMSPPGTSGWDELNWAATVPNQAQVDMHVRTATTEVGLDGAAWVGPFTQTGASSQAPVDISTLPNEEWMQVRVTLTANSSGATPIFHNVDITRYCE